MKALIISDTHGNIEKAKAVLDQTISRGVKAVLHCGDYVSDARLLQKFYPEIEVYSVYGNCDIGFGGAYDEVVTLEEVGIYMTHGHRYGVKWGEYETLAIDAKAHEAKVAVCGHSHQAYLGKIEDVLVMNPGSLTLPRDSKYPSYGIIELKAGRIIGCDVVQLLGDGSVRSHPVSQHFSPANL